MTKRVVAITGIGTLTPAGRGSEILWKRVTSGDTCLVPIDPQKYFDASTYACQVAGQVPPFSEPRVLTEAMMAQTDRCSQMALVAVVDALDAARLPIDFRSPESPVSAERVSLTVATSAAGWTYVEHEMRNLWTKGVGAMDRYGLTAGFPAGPQGHISIFFGVEGRTRTFVSERASGAHALIEGAKAIQRGDAEIAIVGGTEAPLTPLAWAAYNASGMLLSTYGLADNSDAQPADRQHSNMLVAEGSTFLILEEREHARRRSVPILAEISGWHKGTDPSPLENSHKEYGRGLTRSIYASLNQADIEPATVDVIFPGGPALVEEDLAEEAALKNLSLPIPLATSKTILGHLQGAAVATDVAVAALAFNNSLPAQSSLFRPTLERSSEKEKQIKHALVLSGGLGGMYASLLVSKPE